MNRAEKRRNHREGKVADPITLLAASNSPWAPTGYGTQIRQLTTRLQRDGHNIAIASNYGLEATQTEWEGIPILPRGFDAYSNDVVGAYFQDWSRQHPDTRKYVLTLYDVWVFLGQPAWENIPTISWVPIDHSPIPPKVAQWCSRDLVTPVAMSKYGSSALARMDIEHALIPHAIETQLYKPTEAIADSKDQLRTGRQMMNVPQDAAHVTGIVNANKGTNPVRKAFAEQILAWSIFAQDKPDAYLYLHTERFGGMAGVPLDPIIESTGAPTEQIRWVNQYQMRIGIPDDAMAAIYTGLDVLLAATMGEGYGLTVAEAAACETPAIVSDFSAQPELVVDGWKVGGQPYWNPAQQSWLTIPSVPEMVAALNESYERRGERSPESRQHIVDNYDADTVYEHGWRPFLELLP
ncbi:glycosyltransferase [Candidatus Nanopelagicales bacterium]|nr:glycosyltransferase [Candidatus Nanopelagicales bacterium]